MISFTIGEIKIEISFVNGNIEYITFFDEREHRIERSSIFNNLLSCLQRKIKADNIQEIVNQHLSGDKYLEDVRSEKEFYKGLACYLIFLFSPPISPFQLCYSYDIESPEIFSKSFMQFLSIYIIVLAKIADCKNKMYINILNFFNCWDDLFPDGNNFNPEIYNKQIIEIVSTVIYQFNYKLNSLEEKIKQYETNIQFKESSINSEIDNKTDNKTENKSEEIISTNKSNLSPFTGHIINGNKF